ncbi:uncharacterized protein TNCV_3832041 [Trichonephila clavipes]|nr:uncharacterized protein TNCV_3832041 [Trichonephila clavipes]
MGNRHNWCLFRSSTQPLTIHPSIHLFMQSSIHTPNTYTHSEKKELYELWMLVMGRRLDSFIFGLRIGHEEIEFPASAKDEEEKRERESKAGGGHSLPQEKKGGMVATMMELKRRAVYVKSPSKSSEIALFYIDEGSPVCEEGVLIGAARYYRPITRALLMNLMSLKQDSYLSYSCRKRDFHLKSYANAPFPFRTLMRKDIRGFWAAVPCLNCVGGDRWCRHLSSLRGISPSSFVLSPVWCSRPRPTTGVLLAPCHDEFRGPRSDYVRQKKTKMEQSTLLNVGLWSGREKKKREIGMARKRAENRERSLGFPGFVKPVFTKDSKPLGKRKRSLGHLGSVKPVLT